MDPISPEAFKNNQISIPGLPTVEGISFDKLSGKHLLKQHISTSISLAIVLGIAGAVFFYFPGFYKGYFPVVVGLLILLFLWNYFNNWQWQKRSGYALRERDVLFKRGYIMEKTTVIPFNRIQHVSTERGLLDKLLGISTLKVFTAGGSGSDISIPGLTPDLASSLKEALSARINQYV